MRVIGVYPGLLVVAGAQAAANQDGQYQFVVSDGALMVRSVQLHAPQVLQPAAEQEASTRRKIIANGLAPRETALSVALARAWKKGFIEEGVEGARNVLLVCQKETSLLNTMPFMRSYSQQAHCFRF